MNTYESAYSLIGVFVTISVWWFMFEHLTTSNEKRIVHLVWMATFGLFAAVIAGTLWPLTLLAFICIVAVGYV